jgi:hypothetical protein
MLRPFLCAVLAVLLSAGVLLAEFVNGKAKTVDVDKNSITVTIDGKDKVYKVDEKVQVYAVFAERRFTPLKTGLKGVKEGDEVKLSVSPDTKVVTEIYTKTTVKLKKKDK